MRIELDITVYCVREKLSKVLFSSFVDRQERHVTLLFLSSNKTFFVRTKEFFANTKKSTNFI